MREMKTWRTLKRDSESANVGIASRATRILARTWRRDRYAWVIGVIGSLILAGTIAIAVVNWQRSVEWSGMSNGEVLRNLSLAYVAATAFVLAFWRSALASRQSARGDQSLQNERYQKGADMLGSGTLAARLGGIYALERLARDHPEVYYRQGRDLLCAFVRHPTVDGESNSVANEGDDSRSRPTDAVAEEEFRPCRGDVQAALRAVASGRDRISDLSDAELAEADLTDANLKEADLSRTILQGVRGLTQRQLDSASKACAVEAPKLEGARCAETGEPLIWNDK